MRTLQIGQNDMKKRIGGLERYYFKLLESLPSLGTEVRGLVLGEGPTADGVSCYAKEDAPMLRRWYAMRAAISGSSIRETDVVVSHFAPLVFPILDRIGKTPFVVHFHGPWALEGKAEGSSAFTVAAKRALERVVYRRGARFIVLSKAFASILEHDYHVPSELIRIVPGGVDISRFGNLASRDEARQALGWPQGRPTIVTVRRLVRAKGLENLITAVEAVRHDIPDLLLVIVGTGPLEAELKARVRDASLENVVRFEGYVPEEALPNVYRAGDLFVVPTITLEGFGLVVIEALACGTPVLVTPIGGLPEVVSDLEPGLVFESVQPEHLARGIRDAFQGRIRIPGDDECRTYAQRFDWPVIAKRVNSVYAEVVA